MSSNVIIPALVFALASSTLLLARSLWRVGYGAKRQKSIEAFYTGVSIVAASFVALDLIQESKVLFNRNLGVYLDLGCLLLIISITLYMYRASTVYGSATVLRRNAHSWLLIILSISMTGWSYHRIQVRSTDFSFVGTETTLPGIVELDESSTALTDEGTVIPLYRFKSEDSLFDAYSLSSEQKFTSFNGVLIHREQADKMANCHGWVFTEGRFLLKGNDVDRILCDNHYVMVSEPKPGDLVIYRDEMGGILHTALVQGILRDGTIITESKWGIDQRFLHLPADQPYSQDFEYYRTDRPSHSIQIRGSTMYDDDIHNG